MDILTPVKHDITYFKNKDVHRYYQCEERAVASSFSYVLED